jgi:chlorobactene glucosyltransferase
VNPLASSVAFVGLLFVGFALATDDRRRRAPRLSPPTAAHRGAVTILLPVRNEEHNVLPCLDTLLGQTVGPRVRVIDDGSTDRTAQRVAARAAGEPRLDLVVAGPLPAGWRGKVHALWRGGQGVDGPWVLSTDADTRHAPELLARALATAEERGLDAISLAGRQECRGLGENLLTPPVFALLDALLGDWGAAGEGSGPPLANGQFILLRQRAFAACGGFAAIRGAAIDDLAVVRSLRAGGYRTGFFREPGLAVRMYRGWGETFRGWRRNLAGLLRAGAALAGAAALALPAAFLAGLGIAGDPAAAGLLWMSGAGASAILRAGGGHRPGYGLFFPLDSLALAWTLLAAALDRFRGRLEPWKGRPIELTPPQGTAEP